MNSQRRQKIIVLLMTTGLMFLAASANPGARETSAPQRGGKFWRPTWVPVGTEFVGHEACAECHADRVKIQQQSGMGQAMKPVAETQILSDHPRLEFRFGKYNWEIVRKGNQSIYSVTDGKETIAVPMLYAFGQGKAGQTYVLEYKGNYYESRVSFYNEIQGLDYTLGLPRTEPDSLLVAFGRLMPRDETLQCFSCHTTGAVIGDKLHLDKMVPGVRCESCHGPGGQHVSAGKAGLPNKDKIFNPARLNADDMAQEFCGSCHRSAEEIFSKPELSGINNVRFQPYRMFNSKCYSDDQRISCTACHDPHESLMQNDAYYDAKCLACHQQKGNAKTGTARGCKIETKKCASCHMPKVDLPGAHLKFTDHRIRIAKPGEPYPF